MDRDNGQVCRLLQLLNLLVHPFGLVGVGNHLLLILRQRDTVGVLGEGGKAKADAVALHHRNSTVDADDRTLRLKMLLHQREGALQSRCVLVEHMVVGEIDDVKAKLLQAVCQLRRRVEQRIAGGRIFCDERRFLVDKGKICLLNQRSDRLISGEEVIAIVGLCLPVDDIVNEVIPDCQQGGVCRRSRRLRRVSRFSLFRFRRGLHRRRLHFGSARGTSAQQSDCQQAGKEMFESHSAPPFTQGTARLPLPQHR